MPTVVAHATFQLPQFWETQPIELKTHRLQKEDKIKNTDCLHLEKDILQMELTLAKHQNTEKYSRID